MDNNHKMPTLQISSGELSLLKQCVALTLAGVFQNQVVASSISSIIKTETGELEALYSKLEYSQYKRSEKVMRMDMQLPKNEEHKVF